MANLTETEASDLFRSPPTRMVPVGGDAEVAVRTVGSGPHVLFVHGWPVHGATFRRLLPRVSQVATCHLVDLPGAGSSRFTPSTPVSIDLHVRSVREVVTALELDDVTVVGHDSGGMIARHALAGDARVRGFGLIDTEPAGSAGWRFRSFVSMRHIPGLGAALGWAAGNRTIRRNQFVFGGAFADRSMLDGEFDEFFLRPLHTQPEVRAAAHRILRSFDWRFVDELAALHRRIDVPVRLIWGERDVFFPVERARATVGTFPRADLQVIEGAGLFSHEERPAEVAAALVEFVDGGRRPSAE